MVIRGTIFHHYKLVFHNGDVGRKFLILLNSPAQDELHLFVKTTSQKKNKPTTPGCIETLSLFFIPVGKTFFEKPTWVQLYQIYQFVPDLMIKDPDIKKVGILKPEIIDEIVNCLFLSRGKDILPDHKKLLRPTMKKSIIQLAEKSKKH